MAECHEGFSVLNVEEEQKEIDKLIASLLEYKPVAKDYASSQKNSPQPKSTPVAASKSTRGRGRPTTRARPPVSVHSPAVDSLSLEPQCLPSMELLITCMEKLNSQNKVLINKVKELESRVLKPCSRDPIDLEHNLASSVTDSTAQLPTEPSAILKSVVEKVDKIEDNINSKLLICRGPTVSRKIASTTENSTTDFGKLKAELCADICGSEITKISVGSFGISLFGKNRDALKIDCSNISVKKHLLNQVRQRKPEGIYLVDFLSPYKRRIHNKLVALKKEKPSVIRAVYIRRGVIFGKVDEDTVRFDSLEDVENIGVQISNQGNSIGSPRPSLIGSQRENSAPDIVSSPAPPFEENGNSE